MGKQGHCIQLEKEVRLLTSRYTRGHGYTQLNTEVGLADLCRSSIWRGTVFRLNIQGEKATEDLPVLHTLSTFVLRARAGLAFATPLSLTWAGFIGSLGLRLWSLSWPSSCQHTHLGLPLHPTWHSFLCHSQLLSALESTTDRAFITVFEL